MKSHVSYRTLTAVCLVCLWATVCVGLNGFTPTVIAQEPTTDSLALPTPTTAPTWTPTVVGTPDPHATSPSGTPATPTGRVVDFRVDDRKISPGECVTFSWLVRGDIDKVEFDEHDDNKNAVLVPEEQYDAEECPSSTTEYYLNVTWLDGTRTTQIIKVRIESDSDDGDGEANQTATPGGTAASFMPVTPLPISGISGGSGGVGQGATPQSVAYQSAPDGVVVTPVGALGSVILLPETGYGPPPAADEFQAPDGPGLAHLMWQLWPSFAAEWGAFLGGMVVIGLILSIKHTH